MLKSPIYRLVISCLIGVTLAGRLAMMNADFPPISASVSEYGDMGYCLHNVRSKLLYGDWNYQVTTVSLGSVCHSFLVYVFCLAGGLSSAMVRAVSMAAFFILWMAAFIRWRMRVPPRMFVVGLLLLSTQHVLYAYSYSWKQEMLMVSLSMLGLMALDRRSRGGCVASGVLLSLAFLTKFNSAGSMIAALTALAMEERPLADKIKNIAAWAGAFLLLPLLLLGAAWARFDAVEWANLTGWLTAIVSDRVGHGWPMHDRIMNIFKMNVILRSLPELSVGLGLALPSFFDKRANSFHRALVVVILIHLFGAVLAPHYPLRWILPAVAAAVFLSVEAPSCMTWKKIHGATVTGVLCGQAGGFLLWRYVEGASIVLILGIGAAAFVCAGLLVSFVAARVNRRFPDFARAAVWILALSTSVHLAVTAGWVVERREDQDRISRDIEATVAAAGGGSVRPASFIGWQVLWPTGLAIDSGVDTGAAYLLWDSTVSPSATTLHPHALVRYESQIGIPRVRIVLYRMHDSP